MMSEFDQENIEDTIKSIIENDLIKKIENNETQTVEDNDNDNDDVNELKYRIKQLEHKLNEKINEENNYENEIVKLKQTISDKDKENQSLEHKLNEIETSTRLKLEQINADFQKKFSDAFKQFEECQKDTKTSMIMKYAQAEKRYLDSQRNCDMLTAKINNLNKEKQRLCDNIEKLKSDKQKQIQEYEQKLSENNALKKQFDKIKEDIVLNNAKINVEQIKYKKEYESHVRTKLVVENLERQINELTQKLSKYEPDDKQDAINGDNSETNGTSNSSSTNNGESSNSSTTITNEEIEKLKEKINNYESECKNYELIIQKYNETLQNQKQMNKDLLTEVLPLRELQVTLTKEQHEKKLLQTKLDELQNEINELNQEMFKAKQKQSELLEFTSKLTEKNTKLQSDNQLLNEKVDALNKELENTKMLLSKSEDSVKLIAASLNEKLNEQIKQNELLDTKLKEKTKLADELNTKLNDEQDENQSLKRKHAANIKDLSKQIQKLQKQIDGCNNNGNTNQQQQSTKTSTTVSQNDHNNGHSSNNQLIRTNSITSLDKEEMRSINGSISSSDSAAQQTQQQQQHQSNTQSTFNSYDNNSTSAASTDVYVVDVDKQKIIEKVVKLQKSLAKRNEKIDFLQDHVNQLTFDLQRKTKIIQAYAMKDDVGAFSGDGHEAAKRLLSRNGNNMTMELCMEINGKLQSLLEDTLIKNVTLKESIERLGEEIAHLTEENRHLKRK